MVPCAYTRPPTGSQSPSAQLLLRQPRLGPPWRHYQLGREDDLHLADAMLHYVSTNELDHGRVELEPACLSVLGVVADQERLALRMMLMPASKPNSAGCSPIASQNRIPLDTSSVEKT
jgi:hypothetical protein